MIFFKISFKIQHYNDYTISEWEKFLWKNPEILQNLKKDKQEPIEIIKQISQETMKVLPKIQNPTKTPSSNLAKKPKTIVFVTSEMGILTLGGMGYFLYGTIKELMHHNFKIMSARTSLDHENQDFEDADIFKIIILYDFKVKKSKLESWKSKIMHEIANIDTENDKNSKQNNKFYDFDPKFKKLFEDWVKMIDIDSILTKKDKSNLNSFYRRSTEERYRSMRWAIGVSNLFFNENFKFDAIEFPDFAGPAYYSLKARQITQKPQKISKTQKFFKPLPDDKVQIIVRFHGTLEFIDLAESTLVVDKNRQKMYQMERFSLEKAKHVLYPSEAMKDFIAETYKLPNYEKTNQSQHGIVSNPLNALLDHIKPVDYDPASSKTILFFGKLTPVKGVFLITDAAVQMFENHPEIEGKIVFFGPDTKTMTGKSTKSEILKRIPKKYLNRFGFITKRVETYEEQHKIFNELVKPRAAIVASHFETLNLVAHEIYKRRVPLIVSNFASFVPFFNKQNAVIFEKFDVSSLTASLILLLTDDKFLQKIRENAKPIKYADCSQSYATILAYELIN